MKMFQRNLEQKISSVLFKGKMAVILGPRQSGKTTLSKKIITSYRPHMSKVDLNFISL